MRTRISLQRCTVHAGHCMARAVHRSEAVAVVRLQGLQSGLHAREHLVTPPGELAGRDAELAAEGVEGLAAEEAQDDLGLAAAGPAAAVGGMVLADAVFGCARPPRALRRRRRLASWLLHGVVHRALESQTVVSRNRAAHKPCHLPMALGLVLPVALPVIGIVRHRFVTDSEAVQ